MKNALSGCDIHQLYGQNGNGAYRAMGLNGHPAVDETCGYGSIIKAVADGYVYTLYTPQRPASDGYTCVYTICQTALEIFEFAYGHPSEIMCRIGDYVKRGDAIAKEGNRGLIYSGGVLITLAMQAAGDKRGSHRHLQKRPLLRQKFASGRYLQTANGVYYDDEGYYYNHAIQNNGFAGCVDWMAPLFARDLSQGATGYDVLLLQRALNLEGFAQFPSTGTFGPKTAEAVKKMQKANGLTGVGVVGPKTRALLNAKYHQLY